MPSSARIQIVDLTTAIGYDMLFMKLNMLEDKCYSPQMMPPSAPVQLADLTTAFGYESFVSKLRLLEDKQATAAVISASFPAPSTDIKSTSDDIDRAGAELRACAGVPALQNLNWQPNQIAPVVTVHDIAQAAYKRNSLNTESVQNLLSILNSGITPSMSRCTSDSSASSFESENFEDFIPMSPAELESESLSICLPGCECDEGVWELSAEWECALEEGFESAVKWVDELVNDD